MSPVCWAGEYRSEGNIYFRIGHAGGDLVAEWVGCCTLRASRSGTASELVAEAGADPDLVAKIENGLVRALLRHLQGKLTIHAAAVALDDKAIACFGESEIGKSTAMAHLAGERGTAFLADDTVAVEFGERIEIVPTERVSWLLPESRAVLGVNADDAGKMPVVPRVVGAGSVPLVALVKLGFDDRLSGPCIRRMRGHEALSSLIPSIVRFVIDEPSAQMHEFEQLTLLTNAVPIFELVRPRNLASLSRTSDALAGIVRTMHSGGTA